MVWRSLPTQPHTVTISKHSLWGYRRWGCRPLLGSWTFTQCWSKWKSLDHAWKGDYKGSSASMVRFTKCGSGALRDARNISWHLQRNRWVSSKMEKKIYICEVSSFPRGVAEFCGLRNVNQCGLVVGYRDIGPILKGQAGPPQKKFRDILRCVSIQEDGTKWREPVGLLKTWSGPLLWTAWLPYPSLHQNDYSTAPV